MIIHPSLGISQALRAPVAAGYLKLGAYSLHHADLFSSLENPAGLSSLRTFAAGVYGEKRYLLKELNNYSAMIGVPTSSGNFGLEAGYFGFRDFNETKLGLIYGRNLGEKLDVGAGFFYQGIQVAGYGNAAAIGFETGGLFHFNEQFHAGIKTMNIFGGKFGRSKEEKLSSVYSLGFGFEGSKKFFAGFEFEKEEDRPLNLNAGIQYKFLPFLQASLGLASATATGWTAIGLNWKNWRFDFISSYHPYLGISPGLLLLYQPLPKSQ